MRLTVLVVLAALAVARAQSHRKSLAFGPHLTHARFDTAPVATLAGASADKDPHAVARAFVSQLFPAVPGADWKIRHDSYTDKNTGVSHVYVRQYINGLEVADGNLNLNIKDGQVLSYGDSFYRGSVPDTHSSLAHDHTHAAYCAQLSAHAFSFDNGEHSAQSPLSVHGSGSHRSLPDLYEHNCGRVAQSASVSRRATADSFNMDPREAAMNFILHATPNQSLADEIANDFQAHIDRISSTPVSAVHGNHWTELLDGVPETVSPVKARLAYVQTPSADGTGSELNLVWKLEVEMQDNWYDAAVSAVDSSAILSVVDWVSDSPMYPQPAGPVAEDGPHLYNVFPWGVNDPSEGERVKYFPKPDPLASPFGWHSIPAQNDPNFGARAPIPGGPVWVNYSTTFGPNVFAQENWEGRGAWLNNYRPPSSTKWPSLTFDFPYNPKASNDSLAEAQHWINNTITQLFYTGNQIHDLYYRYGFDEVSGNFQQYNYERGGQEGDAVITNAQDGSGYNNANFATPPDGQNGRCRMYLWNTATPYRDGDLEAGIVIHEYSHGLSTRLTGGPSDSSCLAFGEGGGMGEGWGDFLATMIRSNANYSDYPMGAWAANSDHGIRNYPYSTNVTINPSTYKTLDSPGYWGVHAIGEVWAEILFVIAQKFIEAHGFSDTLFPPAPLADGTIPEGDFYRPRPVDAKGSKIGPLVPKHGNTLLVQLVFDGMKLQPCRPGFFEARNAIIQADELLTGGENFCLLWDGFSSRGLGRDASVVGRTPWGGGVRRNGHEVPVACRGDEDPAPTDPEDPEDDDDDDDDDDWLNIVRWVKSWA